MRADELQVDRRKRDIKKTRKQGGAKGGVHSRANIHGLCELSILMYTVPVLYCTAEKKWVAFFLHIFLHLSYLQYLAGVGFARVCVFLFSTYLMDLELVW